MSSVAASGSSTLSRVPTKTEVSASYGSVDPPEKLVSRDAWVAWCFPDNWGNRDEFAPGPYLNACFAREVEGYDGIAIDINENDNLVAIRLTDCRDAETGEVESWAQEVLDEFGSYAYSSTNGTSVMIVCEGKLPDGCPNNFSEVGESGNWKIFDYLRRIPVTGVNVSCRANGEMKVMDVVEAQAAINKWFPKLFGPFPDFDFDCGSTALNPGDEVSSKVSLSAAPSPATGSQPAKPGGWDPGLLTCPEFYNLDFDFDWLVEDVMVAGQSGVIGAPPKMLKTAIAMELGFSVATATPFLGRFAVKRPRRVGFISAESGGSAVNRRLKAIAASRDISLQDPLVENLSLSVKCPKFTNDSHLEGLRKAIVDLGLEVLLVDPAYLCVGGAEIGGNAGNNMVMGHYLQRFNECGAETGCTMALVHHMSKSSMRGSGSSYPSLSQLSMAGYSEWARQWILLKREGAMKLGKHKLKATIGGSAGHHGNYRIEIDEGFDRGRAGHKWEVRVEDPSEATNPEHQRATETLTKTAERKQVTDETVYCKITELHASGEGATASSLYKALGYGVSRVHMSLDRLKASHRIVGRPGIKKGNECVLFEPTPF